MVQTALRYEVVEGWEQLPPGYSHPDVAGVGVDSQDNVWLICRGDHPIIVYNRDGKFLRSWGEGKFTLRTHGITIGPDDSVWTADDGDHTIRKWTPDGELLLTLGTPNQPSDTGYVMGKLETITHGGPPFNRCTNTAIAPSGEVYVSDGYGNCRVHRFSAKGDLIQSWGEPGSGPGQFMLPHGIWAHRDGRIFVADRENDRIQIFSPDGEYLSEWTDVQRPTQLFMDDKRRVYVSELWWRPGQTSYRNGKVAEEKWSRISVYDDDGNVLARWTGDNPPCGSGSLCAPHSIAADSRGDIYVGEVTNTFAISRGAAPADCNTFMKFALKS
jgi:DNA-binding beta-propeller fold protein YncE